MQGWAPTLKKDVKVLKHVQRRGMEGEPSCEGLEGTSYKEQLRALGFLFREMEAEKHCFLQLPEEGVWRGRCWTVLSGIQGQHHWEWSKVMPVEDQTGH